MGATAEVDELPLPVERERGVIGEASLDVLDLQRLLEIADDLHRLAAWHLHPLERLVGLDDPLHFGLDGRQVFVGDRPRGPHVVIEALADRGAEGEFHAVKQPHHRPGHDMGRRVPHHGQGPGIAREQGLEGDRAGVGQRGVEADSLAVEDGGDRRPTRGSGRAGSRCCQNVTDAGGGGTLVDGAVGESNVEHEWNSRVKRAVFSGKPERIWMPAQATSGDGRFRPSVRPSLDAARFRRETLTTVIPGD